MPPIKNLLLIVFCFIAALAQAEETPALEMTGMRVDTVTQTTETLELTGMASEPKTINVEQPKQPKK